MQRGRKSVAHLSIVPILNPGQYAQPPSDLTTAEAKLWVAICATKPTSWFAADTYPILKEYVRHCIESDRLTNAIHVAANGDLADITYLKVYAKLLSLRAVETAAMLRCATTMRLTQSSRATSTATTAANSVSAADKPWSTAAVV